ncbi:MAG: hypothetical protein ABIW38_00050 [Ferruginibacter sp.]
MRLRHFDYIKLVKESFKKKLKHNQLSPLLAHSTPGNIRLECAHVYEERAEKKDEPMLRSYFGPGEPGRKYLKTIQEFDVNKLKTLDKYLKSGGKEGISDRSLDLLAWLIDFPHRPFRHDNDVILSDEEMALLGNVEDSQHGDIATANAEAKSIFTEEVKPSITNKVAEEQKVPGTNSLLKKGVKRAAVILGIGVIGWAGYSIMVKEKECMYWTGDHYEKVDCKEKRNGKVILPVDEDQLAIRKITREDSIKERHIGQLYYIKYDNDIQYYTQKGKYPEDHKRELQKLSRHIFDKDSNNRRLPENNLP